MGLTNRIAGAAAILVGLSAPPAQAGYVVDLTQLAGNVVATGSGAIDLTGLSFRGSSDTSAIIWPSRGQIVTGPTAPTSIGAYAGVTGPTSFGSGGSAFASSGSGDLVAISGIAGVLLVPLGYVSGMLLSDTSTYDGQTFATLRATPGRHEWTWGTGPDQNFTLVVGTVPEPSTWAMTLLGLAGLGFLGYADARRRSRAARSL